MAMLSDGFSGCGATIVVARLLQRHRRSGWAIRPGRRPRDSDSLLTRLRRRWVRRAGDEERADLIRVLGRGRRGEAAQARRLRRLRRDVFGRAARLAGRGTAALGDRWGAGARRVGAGDPACRRDDAIRMRTACRRQRLA